MKRPCFYKATPLICIKKKTCLFFLSSLSIHITVTSTSCFLNPTLTASVTNLTSKNSTDQQLWIQVFLLSSKFIWFRALKREQKQFDESLQRRKQPGNNLCHWLNWEQLHWYSHPSASLQQPVKFEFVSPTVVHTRVWKNNSRCNNLNIKIFI